VPGTERSPSPAITFPGCIIPPNTAFVAFIAVMDPLSITTILVSALGVTKSISKFLKDLKDVNDPKVKVIRTSLLTQNRRTRGWFQKVNIADKITLQKRIHPEDLELVNEFLDDIKVFQERAEAALEKLVNPSLTKSNLRRMKAKLWWVSRGYKNLNLLVKALELLNNALHEFTNNALYEFTEPPPPYPRSPWNSPRTQPSQFPAEDSEINPQLPDEEQLRPISEALSEALRRSDPTPSQRAHQSETATSSSSLTERTDDEDCFTEEQNRNVMKKLCVKCLGGLRLIATESELPDEEEAWYLVIDRLNIWACGLFQKPSQLDQLLDRCEEGLKVHEDLRVAIIGAFVDIALLEVELLGWISTQRTDTHQEKVLEVRDDVHAFLGGGQLLDITFERPSLDPFGEVNPKDIRDQINGALDSLFDLLPAIRTIRRQWILELEYYSMEMERRSSSVMPGLRHGTTFTTDFSTASTLVNQPGKRQLQYSSYLLEKVLDSSIKYVQSLEASEPQWSREGDQIQARYAELVRKERGRLEEWSQEVKRRDPNSWTPKKEQIAREILKSYATNLVLTGATLRTGRGKPVDVPMTPKLMAEKLNEGNDRLWKLIE
jgi:hypothetical protein